MLYLKPIKYSWNWEYILVWTGVLLVAVVFWGGLFVALAGR